MIKKLMIVLTAVFILTSCGVAENNTDKEPNS